MATAPPPKLPLPLKCPVEGLAPRWSKVASDLRLNRGRALLVVLTIWVGVCAIGMIQGASEVIDQSLAANGANLIPPSVTLTSDDFGPGLVTTVQHLPGVAAVDARRAMTVRMRTPDGRWHDAVLFALADFDQVPVSRIIRKTGTWPPGAGEMLLERSGLSFFGIRSRDRLTVEMPGGLQTTLRAAGSVLDLAVAPASNRGVGTLYVSMDELGRLGQPHTFNQLDVVTTHPQDWGQARAVATAVRNAVEGSGLDVTSLTVPQPGSFWANESVGALILMLTALGILAVFMSSFLVINTSTALMAQELRQIGVMKAVGAGIRQMAGVYAAMILVFGLAALLLALPAASAGAQQLIAYATRVLNFDALPYHLSWETAVLEVLVALVLPLAAAAGPIFKGSRITIREAISGGRAERHGEGLAARLATRLDLSGAVAIGFANATRKKLRAAFTMVALVTGTATFIAVLSVQASIGHTVEREFDLTRYDVELNLARPYPAAVLTAQARTIPGVRSAEAWQVWTAYPMQGPTGSTNTLTLIGFNPATDLVRTVLVSGRKLLPTDQNAVVVNTDVLKDNPELRVGHELPLRVNRKTTAWKVVGVVQGFGYDPTAYANYGEVGAAAGAPLQASRVAIVGDDHSVNSQQLLARLLEQRFGQAQLHLGPVRSIGDVRAAIESSWAIIVNFLVAMSVLMGIVGGLGLAGTMGINVTERTREIGVMRAVGATGRTVMLTVMTEGLLLALLSWALGLAASIPLSSWFSEAVGRAFIYTPLAYRYSIQGAMLWLAIQLAIAALASWLPARRAARLTVRDVLTYEG